MDDNNDQREAVASVVATVEDPLVEVEALDLYYGETQALFNNVDLARQVGQRDEQVDLLRDQIFRELLSYVHAPERPDTVEGAIYLILVSRHLERIGDHASNIAENVFYLVQARIVRHQKEVWWKEESRN